MSLNAVERRLVEIRGMWEAFTEDPAKRLLVWKTPAAALRLAECFFEAQKHEAQYSTQDLCIVFTAPFEHSIQYSRALKEALAGSYAASREALERDGIPADWAFAPERLPDSALGFVQALRSLGGQHHAHIKHLAAVLMPAEVASDRAFADWLRRALQAGLPERLRIAVLDPAEAPRLEGLAEGRDPRIRHDALALDIMAVAQETFAQETSAVGPAAVFRNLLMSLVVLVERGSAAQVRAKAADAYAFARQQGWDDQQVTVAVLVAGAQIKERRFDDAIQTYRLADGAARRTMEAGHPAGKKLLMQAVLGEAGAQLAAGRTTEAVARYDGAADVALSIPDLLLAVEALRMGAFCRARMGDAEGALERGRRVLETGGRLRAEVRGLTTLPIAAADMLRVLDADRANRIEALRAAAEAGSDAALERAEAEAAGLEHATDRTAFEAVERGLAASRAAAWKEAEARLRHVVAGGDEAFREVFAHSRRLLGAAWPLGADAADALVPPRAPIEAEAHRRAETAAP